MSLLMLMPIDFVIRLTLLIFWYEEDNVVCIIMYLIIFGRYDFVSDFNVIYTIGIDDDDTIILYFC